MNQEHISRQFDADLEGSAGNVSQARRGIDECHADRDWPLDWNIDHVISRDFG